MTQRTEAVAVVTPGAHVAGQWTNKEAEIIATVLGKDLTPDDVRAYAAICRHTGLDPFLKQIYAWRDGNRLTIHIAIGGWRGMAAISEAYNGQTPIEWCGPDGEWKDVWLSDAPPAAARCGVYRVGAPEAVVAVVTWKEFERTKARVKAKNPTVWDEKPAHQLGIRAEYHALQKACPEAFAKTQEIIKEYAATVDVADEGAIPEPPAAEQIDTVTGEVMDPTDDPATEYAWEETLGSALIEAGLGPEILAAVVGTPATYSRVNEWFNANPGATPAELVKRAADAAAEVE